MPLYPLPSRAFPVQPPAKYPPPHPADTRGPVRKWQIVQREIRGIAGGRWFARSWLSPATPDPDPDAAPAPAAFANGHHRDAVGPVDGVMSRGPGSSRTRTSVSPTSPGSAGPL